MPPAGPAVLVVAHPGHELRLFGWMTRAKPVVHVLTDGSGATGTSRLASTTRVLSAAGATPGAVYGPMTDAALYAAVLSGRVDALLPHVTAIADAFSVHGTRLVVADAAEGYNPAHDLAGVVVAAAVARLTRRGGTAPERLEYAVVGSDLPARDGDRVHCTLDEETLRRKVDAALAYGELRREVEGALSDAEAAQAATECLVPVDATREPGAPPEDPPFYERHGERRVREGRYADVLRYRRHLRPFACALMERASEAAA